jgi:hypothetical protein
MEQKLLHCSIQLPAQTEDVINFFSEQDGGGIPSQFPVQEDTQFCQILRESLDFFGIEESRHKEFFLVDHKTRKLYIIYNLTSFCRFVMKINVLLCMQLYFYPHVTFLA